MSIYTAHTATVRTSKTIKKIRIAIISWSKLYYSTKKIAQMGLLRLIHWASIFDLFVNIYLDTSMINAFRGLIRVSSNEVSCQKKMYLGDGWQLWLLSIHSCTEHQWFECPKNWNGTGFTIPKNYKTAIIDFNPIAGRLRFRGEHKNSVYPTYIHQFLKIKQKDG